MPNQRLNDDKAAIRAELEKRARTRQTITHVDAADLVKRANQGLVPILDMIRGEEAAAGRPDLGCLVVRTGTGLPGHVMPGKDNRRDALAVREAVFQVWAKLG